MRRRARVSRSESTSPARVLLASGERDGDGAGSPSLPPPAETRTTTTTTTTTTSKTFAVDAADATALVADLVVAHADADLADVLATSLTVAIEVEESGAHEAGGVGDGERTAVLCELVLDRTNEARGAARRWRPTAPNCTATRVVDVDETADEGARAADVLRVEASLSPRRHPTVRLAAVTLTRTTTLVGAKPAASTNPSPSLPPPPLDVRAVAVVTGEDVDALARAWLARAARCAADALPATVAACGRKVPFPFPGAGGGDALVVAVVDDARLRGCCAATRVYHAEECACALDVFDVASDMASDVASHAASHAAGEEGPFTRDDESDEAGLNGVPLAFPPPGSVAAEDRTLAIALHRLCATSDTTSDATLDATSDATPDADSCVASSAVMTAASASAARLLSGTRGGDRTSLAAQSSGAASDVESDVAHDVASDVASFLSWLDGDARETRPEVFTQSTAFAAPPPRPRPPPSPRIPPPPPPTTATTATTTTTATNTTTTATKNWHPDGAFFAVVVVALLVAGLFVVVVCVRLARRWRATSGGDDVGGTGIADEEGEGGEVLLVRRRATPHPGKP